MFCIMTENDKPADFQKINHLSAFNVIAAVHILIKVVAH